MSLKSSLWRYLGLLAVAALAVGVFAGPASAKKLSAKQRAAVRAQLKKQIKKNPAVINKRSFVKRASLANFRLPVTVALRTGDKPGTPANESATANQNSAKIDLGTSLGNREVNLGGSLKGVIQFHDSYDGGALGNVDLELVDSPNHQLTSTSIPLLWNSQVTQAGSRWDANALGLPDSMAGCSTFLGSAALPFGAGLAASGTVGGIPQPGGLPGYPYFADLAGAAANTPIGFLPQKPGVDAIDQLVAAKNPGSNTALGGNPDPFPTTSPDTDPGVQGTTGQPNIQQTVLRTSALKLNIADPATEVNQSNGSGVEGSQNIKMGKSGGQANLFGNIPGKPYGIDVTVNLATKINSILRIVDQDTTGAPLLAGEDYPAGIFGCRQVYTGYVQNYIPAVHLKGDLKIAPAVTAKGHLRIAKATLSGLGTDPSRFAVAACLAPYASYTAEQNGSDGVGGGNIPGPAVGPSSPLAEDADMPGDVTTARATPDTVACNTTPTGLVRNSALAPSTVDALTGGSTTNADGIVTGQGDKVSVAADLTVNKVVADVLIGDVAE